MGWRAVREAIDRVATPKRILIAGWVWFLVYAYPGYMSYDSVYQLGQARHLEPMNEWHPPLMAILWRYLDFFVAGPFPMLVLQSVLFLVGMYLLLRRVMPDRAAAIVTAVLMIAPQNIIVMAVIWKDSLMAGFLLAALAALQSDRRGWRVAGYACLFFATAMRYNSAAATLPIILFYWSGRGGWLRRYASATGVWLAITAAALLVNSHFVEVKKYPFQTATAPVDVIGTLRFAGRLTDEQILADTPGVPWVKRDKIKVRIGMTYKPENTFLDVTQHQGWAQMFIYPTTDAERAAFAAAWKKLIAKYPLAFARHRVEMFRAQLDVAVGVWAGFTNADWGADWIHHDAAHSPVQEAWVDEMLELTTTIWFRVGAYFVLAFTLLPLCRRNRLAFVLLASGILYELGLFALAPATDYRYSHWMVCCTLLATVVLFATRLRGVHQRAVERGAEPLGAALVPDAPHAG